MANLVSPGVQVTISDESVYGPTGAGTVPMLFIATGADKADPTGTEADGIAKYTKSAEAGKPVLVTSQRELTQYFGNVDFRKVAGSVMQGDETNEYGLLAAYSYLGQSSAAYIVRANCDLTSLRPLASAPVGDPNNNTYWFNPTSDWGMFEYTTSGWTAITPTVEIVASGAPTATVVDGNYLVLIVNGLSETKVEYYIGESGAWEKLDSSWATGTATLAPHYSVPSSPTAGDVWIKTTRPGAGTDLNVSLFTTLAGNFVAQNVVYAQAGTPAGTTADTFADGTAATARAFAEGEMWMEIGDGEITLKRYDSIQAEWDDIGTDDSVATGGYTMIAQVAAPTGAPADGTVWFDPDVNDLAIYEVAMDGPDQKWKRVEDIQYGTSAPTSDSGGAALADGDYWIDTDADGYPVMYRHNGSAWVRKNNADQSTSDGIVFGDITANDTTANTFEASLLAGAPDPLLYPVGMSAVNMCRSANTVRIYDANAVDASGAATTWKWRNYAGNQVDGSGSFGRLAQRKVVVAAMQASAAGTELREDTIAMRLIAAPGYPEMMDEMVTLNSDRDETGFVIVDAPFRLNPTEAVAWIQGNGAAENGETGLLTNNTYAATYYPHVLTTNPVTGDSVVAPASHSALFTYAYSDNISFQWFAPAGLTRGVVQNAAGVGYLSSEGEFTPVALTQGMRDAMYENKLNPIANFPSDGIVVFGQKTLHSGASALDRVNVARLTAYLRERFAVIARPFLFEVNDEITRENAKSVFEGFLANILRQRGLYDFAVVCDETNNTPARIDANEFYIDVAIEPTKSAEFIYIPIRIVNTGDLS